jgi:tetratricopeptide (TPR) repeat protein
VLPWFSFQMPAGQARGLARDWATEALAQQPDNVDAMAILGLVKQELEQDWAGAQAIFEQALVINPGNLTLNNLYGDFLTRTADFDKALIFETKALELDPLSPVMHSDLAQLFAFMGEYDRAIALAKQARELDRFFPNAVQALGDSYYLQGDTASLEKLWREVNQSYSEDETLQFSTVQVEYMLATQGGPSAKDHLDLSLGFLRSGQITSVYVAFDMSLFGDFDAAGELLLQAYEANDGTWTFPLYVRLPEQAPDSAPWQEFWNKPGVAELAVIRRNNGFAPDIPVAGGVVEK